MNPWTIDILGKTKEATERQLKIELAKRTAKHVEILTPLRVWLGLLPEMEGYIYRVRCNGWLNGRGASIEATVALERLYE